MNLNKIINDIEQLLIGKQLQSINPKTSPIYVIRIDRDAEKYFVASSPNAMGISRSLSELESIWTELSRKGFSNVDQALYGSHSSRNQPETIFANLPYIQHFKYKKKKHILLRGKNIHEAGTLSELQGAEFRFIKKKIDNYFLLSNQMISDTQSEVINTLKEALDSVLKKYPGDAVIQDAEKALNQLSNLEKQIHDAIVTLDDELSSLRINDNFSDKENSNLSIDSFMEDSLFTGIEDDQQEYFNNTSLIEKISIKDYNTINILKIRQLTPVLSLIFDRLKFKEIELQPDFQRKDRIWENDKKSKLIESILMGLPLPVFYFAEKPDSTWIVVDGLQRITSVYDYMIGDFKLEKLKVLKDGYNGKKFNELSRTDQRKIREYPITVHLIDLPQEEGNTMIVELFHRINTYGAKLSDQEIRSALNQGTSVKFLRYVAASKEFKQATRYKIRSDRQKDMGLCLSSLAFMILGYKKFDHVSYDSYLSEAMIEMNKYQLKLINDAMLDDGESLVTGGTSSQYLKLMNKFYRGLTLSNKIFGEIAFRKERTESNRSPISKSLFEILVTCLSELDDAQAKIVIEKNDELIDTFYNAIRNDSEEYAKWDSARYKDEKRGFLYSISTSTGKKVTIKYRFEAFIEILKKSTGVNIELKPLKEQF
ncbi:DUF262 domain-containing protein [Xenorhabdus bovienii]|uniref:GmrSD restriction endonucleases N-terminal domain-containing protein n=1 Tax=Xenorhabdus bovienii str. feltiae Moldova TaxID=1398200 RepID=A0A077NQ35_XENBV|nr:DUF262 domain-containing protein [Xenorhabdus bovienii]CDG99791.1 conserved hypothetical protein [Xenorhabdus bovienii str. feltiae Moldova]